MLQIFKDMGYGSRLLFLVLFSLVGLIFGNLISNIALTVIDGNNSLLGMRLAQVITTFCWLLLSSLLYLYLFQDNAKAFLKISIPKSILPILLTIVLVVVIQPLVGFLGYLNQSIVFPESLAPLESLFREIEELTSHMVAKMISDKSVLGIIANFLIIAVFAAVVEEIFFRGCMQQLILKIVKNKHIAVWISAIIFSAVHMEFYGLIPRILLGAMLGYLFVWTSNLWIPIIAHFVNNFMAVLLQTIYIGTPEYDDLDKFDVQSHLWYLLASIVLSGLLVYILPKVVKNKSAVQLYN